MSPFLNLLKASIKRNFKYVGLLTVFTNFFFIMSSSILEYNLLVVSSVLYSFTLLILCFLSFLLPANGTIRGRGMNLYSLKYFEGLPLSRSQILILALITNLFLLTPAYIQIGLLVILFKKLSWTHGLNIVLTLSACAIFVTASFFMQALTIGSQTKRSVGMIKGIAISSILILLFLSPLVLGRALKSYATKFDVAYLSEFFIYLQGVKYVEDFYFTLAVSLVLIVAALGLSALVVLFWKNEKLAYWQHMPTKYLLSFLTLLSVINYGGYQSIQSTKLNIFEGNDLNIAIQNGDEEQINKMGQLPEYYDKKNRFGVSPLMVALIEKDCQSFETLRQAGFKEHDRFYSGGHKYHGLNLLGLVVVAGCTKSLETLIGQEYEISQKVYKSGISSLHLAAKFCEPDVAESLLKWGANPDEKDDEGNTPLFYAAFSECHAVNQLLKLYEADFSIKNEVGEVSRDWLPEKPSASSLYFYKKQAQL